MATEVLKRVYTGDNRISFKASWEQYEVIARAVGDQRIRLAFDGERVELMSPGTEHEDWKELVALMVRALASALGVPCKGMGSSRWTRPEASRGVEADSSFYLTADKHPRARLRPKKDEDWPLPDLAVEIDMSPSEIDRPGIYASLGVPEIWRFDGESFRIDRLGLLGTYAEAAESVWFGIRSEEIFHLLTLNIDDDNDFSEQVRAWARNVLVPRRNPAGG